jgi:hypothetical protein
MSYKENFINTVIEKSSTDTWSTAKREWEHIDTYEAHGSTCICGKEDITDVCVIKNHKTNEVLHVGNQCVKKVGVNVDDEFRWIKGKRNSIPESILRRAYLNQIILESDYLFYINIQRKRQLSTAQTKWKNDIEYKIKEYMKNKRGVVDSHAFKNIPIIMKLKKQHKVILLENLKALYLKVRENEIDIEDHMKQIKGILISLNELKKTYKKNELI